MSVVEQERTEETSAPAVTVRDVLHRSADLLEEFGWCQGNYACRDGLPLDDAEVFRGDSFCSAGAMIRAASELMGQPPRDGTSSDPWLDDCYAAFTAAIGESGFADQQVADWNDAPGRTKAEVVARLRDAANAA